MCRRLFVFLLCFASVASAKDVCEAPKTVFGGDRPVTLQVPSSYDAKSPMPLVIVLHGYGSSSEQVIEAMRIEDLMRSHPMLIAVPEGTMDQQGRRFWNATNACCNFGGIEVDDVGYLERLIKEISRSYNVDPKRVFVVGFSNGGFMAHRFACERPELVAAVVSLAGATWFDASRCQPKQPVSVLQIHGTADTTVQFGGNAENRGWLRKYPSAQETVSRWAKLNRCTGPLKTKSERLDLDGAIEGKETRLAEVTGCPAGVGVGLWTIEGGRHIPELTGEFAGAVWKWLAAHARR